MITVTTASAQYLGTARLVAIGASTTLAGDISAVDWNPAGLSRISSWEFSATGSAPLAGDDRSSSLRMIGFGHRFDNDMSAAFRYSPGIQLEFVVPTTFIYDDSSTYFVTQFDKKIRYEELFGFGGAWKPAEAYALGASLHYFQEQVTDTRYPIDTSSFIRSTTEELTGTHWTVDLGFLWQLRGDLRVGLSASNLIRGNGSSLPAKESQYHLDMPRVLRAGFVYTGWPGVSFAVDGDTKNLFHAGADWRPAPLVNLRAGMYVMAGDVVKADALAAGIGGRFGNIRVDLSYLRFLSQENRTGTPELDAFRQSDFHGIEYNAFTSDHLTLTATLNVGAPREASVRIERVDMPGEMFPVSRSVYAYAPVGTARVVNAGSRAVEAKVSFYVDRYMDFPTVGQPVRIEAGDTAEIPFSAVLNERFGANVQPDVADAQVTVVAASSEESEDPYVGRVMIRGRNDWNGDASLLKYFVTPGDPDVVKFSRSALVPHKAQLDTLPGRMQNFVKARLVFEELAKNLQYVGDPKQNLDNVQYPSETLKLKTGDCDDMSACYAALLGSVGISTAFVDVVPPESPAQSHLYLMFDTGMEPTYGSRVSPNPKRYVVRKNDLGGESIWIPIETTAIARGFDDAWTKGAEEYLQEAEVQLGLVKGWVKIVDVVSLN